MNNKKIRYGFTLAETLIVLTILGIIAGIIIPNIIQKVQDRQTVTKVKRAYSMLDNALQEMFIIEGNPYTWDWPEKSNSTSTNWGEPNNNFMAEKLKNYLPVEKYCGTDTGCFPNAEKLKTSNYGCYKPLYYKGEGSNPCYDNWTDYLRSGKMLLKNGMAVSIHVNAPVKNAYFGDMIGTISVDINGKKGPNMNGIDLFDFIFYEKGLNYNYNNSNYSPAIVLPEHCNKDNHSTYNNGKSCAIWILRHNNMKYKYRDVSDEW